MKLNLTDILINIFRISITILSMAINMRRVMSTQKNPFDDIIFILSTMFGLFIGIYWDNIINYFSK